MVICETCRHENEKEQAISQDDLPNGNSDFDDDFAEPNPNNPETGYLNS